MAPAITLNVAAAAAFHDASRSDVAAAAHARTAPNSGDDGSATNDHASEYPSTSGRRCRVASTRLSTLSGSTITLALTASHGNTTNNSTRALSDASKRTTTGAPDATFGSSRDWRSS